MGQELGGSDSEEFELDRFELRRGGAVGSGEQAGAVLYGGGQCGRDAHGGEGGDRVAVLCGEGWGRGGGVVEADYCYFVAAHERVSEYRASAARTSATAAGTLLSTRAEDNRMTR